MNLRFMGDWKPWVGAAVGLALAGMAWALYRRETRTNLTRLRWALPLLRVVVIFLAVLMLTGPVLHHRKVVGERGRVLVFVDASKSMTLTDEPMELSRGGLSRQKRHRRLRAEVRKALALAPVMVRRGMRRGVVRRRVVMGGALVVRGGMVIRSLVMPMFRGFEVILHQRTAAAVPNDLLVGHPVALTDRPFGRMGDPVLFMARLLVVRARFMAVLRGRMMVRAGNVAVCAGSMMV